MNSLKLLSSLLTMATFASSQPSLAPTYSPTSMETYPPTSLPTGIPTAYPSLVPTDIPTFFPSHVPSPPPTPGTVLIQAIEFNVSQTLCDVNIDDILQYQNITLPAILEAFADSMNIPASAINSLDGEVVICDIDTDRRRLTNSSNDDDDGNIADGGNDDIGSGVPGVRFDVEIVVNQEDVADHDYDSAEDAFNGLINNFNNSDFADILIDVTENSTILSDIFLNSTSGDQDASDDFIPTQVYYTYTAEPSSAPTYQPTPFPTNVRSPSPTNAPSRQPTKLPTSPPSIAITTNNSSDKDGPDNSLFGLFALLALPILAYVVYKARQDQRDDESDDQDQSPTPQVPQARNNV